MVDNECIQDNIDSKQFKLIEITKDEYKKLNHKLFSDFDKMEFLELNKHKVDSIKYFVFNSGKNRFSIVGGIKNCSLLFPFSASFACISNIGANNRLQHYNDFVCSIIEWSKSNNIDSIHFATPPLFYDVSHITKLQNSLINNNFKIESFDINYEFFLNDFDENYINNIDVFSRRHLKLSFKSNLTFEKTNDMNNMYRIIESNREYKGYPLRMSYDEIKETSNIIDSDCFMVCKNGEQIASALVHNFNNQISRVVYWGNIPHTDMYRPMNFLAFHIFKYYKDIGKRIIDIGTSTSNGIPNFGLCDYKESIGCKCSPKITFVYNGGGGGK